ncbi:MAG: hypothetical protein Q4G58_12875 [bacterium]|nr:hypothetical protein [bacterium]
MRKVMCTMLVIGALGITGCQSSVSDNKIVATATTNSTVAPIHTEAVKEMAAETDKTAENTVESTKATKRPISDVAPEATQKATEKPKIKENPKSN